MCRNQHDSHFERELAALEEARGGDSVRKSQEKSGTEQIVQGGSNNRIDRIDLVHAAPRAGSTAAGQSAETFKEGKGGSYIAI